jgi:hypothetical protein
MVINIIVLVLFWQSHVEFIYLVMIFWDFMEIKVGMKSQLIGVQQSP